MEHEKGRHLMCLESNIKKWKSILIKLKIYFTPTRNSANLIFICIGKFEL